MCTHTMARAATMGCHRQTNVAEGKRNWRELQGEISGTVWEGSKHGGGKLEKKVVL